MITPARIVVMICLIGAVLWALLACVASINCGRPYAPDPDFYDSPWLKPPHRRCTAECSRRQECADCLSECKENWVSLFFLGIAAIFGFWASVADPLGLFAQRADAATITRPGTTHR